MKLLVIATLFAAAAAVLPASLAAAESSAAPGAASVPQDAEAATAVLAPSTPVAQASEPAPQDTFQGCPFADVFWFSAPIEACFDSGAGCGPLCADAGGTLIFGATSTGADCTCVCCRS